MSNYVATYRRLDENAARAENQADEYRKRADEDRWEQCRIAHEATTEGGYTYAAFGKAVSGDPTTISRQASLWRENPEPAARPDYWTAMAALRGHSTGSERTREMAITGARKLPAADKAKLAAELLEDDGVEVAPSVIARQASRPDVARAIARNDDTREAVEEAAIDHRARFHDTDREERMTAAPRQSAAGMARALKTDLATSSLRQAAGLIAEAVFEREEFGIQHPDAERDALDRVHRAIAAYQAGTISDDERGWLESIGVEA